MATCPFPEAPMNILLTRLLGRVPGLPPTASRAAAAGVTGDEAIPKGCGWFDSSHELSHGLWVREHASPDEVANDLPLAFWLELHLSRGTGRPAA